MHGPMRRIIVVVVLGFLALMGMSVCQASLTLRDTTGAGGIEAGSIIFLTDSAGGKTLGTFHIGGSGYFYFFNGRLRLGGGGQSSLFSSEDGGYTGTIKQGGLIIGVSPILLDRWDFPLILCIGGGHYNIEKVTSQKGQEAFLVREGSAFFLMEALLGFEVLATGRNKLALYIGYGIGLSGGKVVRQGLRLTFQFAFALPKKLVASRSKR